MNSSTKKLAINDSKKRLNQKINKESNSGGPSVDNGDRFTIHSFHVMKG